ncbi:hypothetical protein O3P69_002888 [Scylla paramamosain]|uniref:Uncharacterized protein n=1 Tax=Scylla paramamosain TaxID=85552 RepID=A0AAW0UT27_SCYPA
MMGHAVSTKELSRGGILKECAVTTGRDLFPPVRPERWSPGEQARVPRYLTTCPAALSSHSCTKHLCFLNRRAILVPSDATSVTRAMHPHRGTPSCTTHQTSVTGRPPRASQPRRLQAGSSSPTSRTTSFTFPWTLGVPATPVNLQEPSLVTRVSSTSNNHEAVPRARLLRPRGAGDLLRSLLRLRQIPP